MTTVINKKRILTNYFIEETPMEEEERILKEKEIEFVNRLQKFVGKKFKIVVETEEDDDCFTYYCHKIFIRSDICRYELFDGEKYHIFKKKLHNFLKKNKYVHICEDRNEIVIMKVDDLNIWYNG
jgi:hypothetical protein